MNTTLRAMLPVQIKILDERARSPEVQSDYAAGYDLVACIDKPLSIRAGAGATLVPTGVAIYINDPNVAALIVPRSGLGHKQGLVLGNTLGLIDSDYQGQWFVSAWNRGQQDEIIIHPGDKIAQAIFVPVLHVNFETVTEFTTSTNRGAGGFGSTGA